MRRIVVISALQSEVSPLVSGWSRESLVSGGKAISCFASNDVVAAAGGIGAQSSEQAARVLVERYRPELLISAGFAGSLIEDLKTGSIVVPEVVIDAATGTQYRCEPLALGELQGVLVTDVDVAGKHAKAGLAHKFHASIVDMEAAGVARVAREKGIAFCCVKAISDELEFSMPPLGRFVQQGEFHTLAFLRWVALRPRYWRPTIALGRGSARASRALSDWFAHHLVPQFQQAELLH